MMNTLSKAFIFTVSMLSTFGISFSQDSTLTIKKSLQSIEFTGDFFINSNTISNNFISSFYNGKFIDSTLKETISERLVLNNRLGASSKLGFTYTMLPADSKHNTVFAFSFFDRQHFDVKFSDELFNTIFYGNKMYAGQTARLGDFSMNLLRYQQFRARWDWKGDFYHGSYGFAFSLLSGDQNVVVTAPTADLFTAADGTYLDFDIAMKVHSTDTSKQKYFSQNGMGVSTDFYYEMPYIAWKKPGKITFEVRDLGVIQWSNKSMQYAVDSSYHYDGIDVSNLFNLDSTTSPLNIDSVIDKNTTFKTGKYITKIPCTFDVHTKTFYGKQFAFEKGVIFLFNTSSKPYYYAKFHFIFGRNKPADIAYVIAYGGYGRFNAGIEAKFDFAKKYSIHLIENYFFTELSQTSYGMGLYVKLVRRF